MYINDLSNGRAYETVYTAIGSANKTFRQLIDEFSATARQLYNSNKEVRIIIDNFYVLHPFFYDANRVGFGVVAEIGGGLLYSRVICGTGSTSVYTTMPIGGTEVDHSEQMTNGNTIKLEKLM